MVSERPACTHIEPLGHLAEPAGRVCEACSAMRSRWVHPRTYQECGGTRGCHSSPNRYVSKHARSKGHPVIASAGRAERWLYSYPDDALAD